jgi:hypothetical protein
MEARYQKQPKAFQLLYQDLLQCQEQTRAEDLRERQRAQALQNDRQTKSYVIMESLEAYLAHAKVTTGTQLTETTRAASSTQPSQPSTSSLHVHYHQWFTDPCKLPAHWTHHQQEYQEHAHAIMISSSPRSWSTISYKTSKLSGTALHDSMTSQSGECLNWHRALPPSTSAEHIFRLS